MQASGHRFDPDRLHQVADEEMKQRKLLHTSSRPASATKRATRRSLAATDGLASETPLTNIQMMKRNGSPCESTVIGSRRPVFDIVNGFFKIDAVRCSILETRIA